MKKFIVYKLDKKISRTGGCSDKDFSLQAKDDEFVMEGEANDETQKIEFDGLDEEGQPINPRVVDKTPEEIEADNPTPLEIPEGERPACITNEQWRDVLNRLENFENNHLR